MIVENESNWRTDDLEALLKSVMEQPSFQLDYGMHDSTLVLFTTNCKKEKKNIYNDEVKELAAADYVSNPKRYDDTRLIRIRSAKKLEMEVLDKLAHIGDCVQHMNTTNVVALAQAIYLCISRSYHVGTDKLWFAKDMDMRTRPKVTRSKVAIERQITAMEWEQRSIRRGADYKIGKIDEKIDALREKQRKTY